MNDSIQNAMKLLTIYGKGHAWMNASENDIQKNIDAALYELKRCVPPTAPVTKAIRALEEEGTYRSDLFSATANALGYLEGYELPESVLSKYRCSHCEVFGVKLWRGIGSADEAWCSKCGMEQAGFEDTIDDDGKNNEGAYGTSDQIYSSKQGENLLPYIPTPEGETWGYTSVPQAACIWWRELPTRVVS